MLERMIKEFLEYVKITKFADKSIESYKTRLKEFEEYIQQTSANDIKDVTYHDTRKFVGDYKNPSVHVRKARIWSLHQFYHYLELKGLVEENVAQSIPYPKIEKKVPEYLTIEEYNSLLKYFSDKATEYKGLRNLVIIMFLGLLGLRLKTLIDVNVV